MEKIKFNSWGKEWEASISVNRYSQWDNIELELWTIDEDYGFPEPYAKMTVNLAPLTGDYAYLDTNNFPQVEEIFAGYNLGTHTGMFKTRGFCAYPLYQLNMGEIRKYGEE